MDAEMGVLIMRFLILAAAIGAVAIPATANAQYYGGRGGYNYGYNNRDVRQEYRECQRELRRARNRWEYQRELRECRREIAQARRGSYRGYNAGYYGRDRRYWDGYRWRNRW
jgi:hypothetical protein